MIDLRERDREALIRIAAETLPDNAEIWAYGSRVTGRHHDTSDLDLVIRMPPGMRLPEDALDAFQRAVQDSTIPILVQSFDWAQLPEAFHNNILESHAVLRERQT